MGGQTAHGMESHGTSGDGVVILSPAIGPRDRQLDLLVARHHAHFMGDAADGRGVDAGDLRRPLRRVVLEPLLQQLEGRRHLVTVGQGEVSEQVRIGALAVRNHLPIGVAVPPVLVLRIEAARLKLEACIPDEKAEVAGVLVDADQFAGVGVAHQKLAVEQAETDDLVGERKQQRTVGAGPDRHPLVGDSRIAGAHRIDGDEAPAIALELRDGDLERIGVMVLGGADHHEQFGAVEVGPAELPERTTDRVNHAGRHVHRTEAAVGGVVGRAELLGEQAGQRLHLVAAGEQGESLRIAGTDLRQAFFENGEGAFPGDRLELRVAALRILLAQQRPGEARRRILLHDAGTALGADHALIERMVRIAVDVAHLAVAQMHANAAAAGAHVAGGLLDLLNGTGRGRRGLHGIGAGIGSGADAIY